MFKKIYVEITNNCNLNCDFCIKNQRKIEYITPDKFKYLLANIGNYTNYLYFHVLGEPLMHPDINNLIDLASKQYKVNITTNGYLIERIKNNKNIRQINISLHSFDIKYGISLKKYLNNIFKVVDILSQTTYISYRFWTNSKYNNEILLLINNKYKTKILKLENNLKLANNIFISLNKEFIWPDLTNEFFSSRGNCYGLKDHIGILVDGTVIPCCLDTKGIINLGNIYHNQLEEIIKSKRSVEIINGFKVKKKVEKLCQKCNFIE